MGALLPATIRASWAKLSGALRGSLGDLWRYRVGDYRILCDIQDGVLTVLVLQIGNRREVYR
jgi:mRNA interferase RelE/StbE